MQADDQVKTLIRQIEVRQIQLNHNPWLLQIAGEVANAIHVPQTIFRAWVRRYLQDCRPASEEVRPMLLKEEPQQSRSLWSTASRAIAERRANERPEVFPADYAVYTPTSMRKG